MRSPVWIAFGLCLPLTACGSTVEQTSTGSGGGSSSASTSSAAKGSSSATSTTSTGGGVHGDCIIDADCPKGQCVALTQGGYKVCVSKPDEATICNSGGADACCTTSDCVMNGGGVCYAGSDLQFCGGAFPGFNQCVKDACASDADCASGPFPALCAPDGAFGLPKRKCLVAFCHVDSDCTAKPGGACVLVGGNPCCSHPAPDGLGCVYSGGCTTDTDCPGGACELDTVTGEGHCGPPGQGCPP